jgi:FixJ family two-component response regulator
MAISGGGRTGDLNFLELAKQLGAQSALQKPFDQEEFLDAVQEVLQE